MYEPEAVKKAIDNTQDEASFVLSSSGTVRRTYSSVPRRRNLGAANPAPGSQKDELRPCASRTLLSSCLRGQMPAHRCGEPWTPGRADVAPPRLFVDRQLCTLCWPALLRRPLAGALSDRPTERRPAGRNSKK